MKAARRLRLCFVMMQAIGHTTWYRNLRQGVTALDTVDARWVETTLFDSRGLLERLPGVPSYVRGSVRGLLEVRRALRDWPCDVLLFNPQNVALFCQWEMLRRPTILMLDATPRQYDDMAAQYEQPTDTNAAIRLLKHQVNVLNFHLAGALAPCSTQARDSLIHDYGVPPERVHVIPLGIDTDYWRPAQGRLPNDRVRLLFVGGDFQRKGGRLLLEIFQSLGLHERADLHIVTRDDVEAPPGVVVHRNVQANSPELLRLYQAADAFVLPTFADCFPNVLMEAAATGLPVISTAMAGIPDLVEQGRTGYLTAAGDAQALGAALRRLVDDPQTRAALGAAARERAVARFDARTSAARILDLSRALHARRHRLRS